MRAALRWGHLAILLALAAAGGLIALELTHDSPADAVLSVPSPCGRAVDLPGGGVDTAAQRIGLRALDSAACSLGTTREELLLRVATSLRESRDLPPGTEEAIRDGVSQAIDTERDEGGLNAVEAFFLRQVAERAPVSWVVEVVERSGAFG
ncbi:MAG: hypothetical protein AB7V42_03050 [Thermoleophilia bacterium]